MMKRYIASVIAVVMTLSVHAQFYTGMSGLIHVPSADTYDEGDLRVGTYFLNKNFTPERGFSYGSEKYNTMDFYISVTPFWWVEMSYAFTLMKSQQGGADKPRYNAKDRYMSIKFTPLRESGYIPAVSVGANDFLSTLNLSDTRCGSDDKSEYFCNYYVAVTKHVDIKSQRIGVTVAYRRFADDANDRWNGLVGGLTWRPGFAPDGRLTVEWDGCRINAGIDYLLWRHLSMQAAMVDCRYFTGGLCYKVNLF